MLKRVSYLVITKSYIRVSY